MATCTLSHPKNGFTLIEILISLAVISIGLTAILKATTLTIRNTQHLAQKTMASLVAEDVMNRCIAGILTVPKSPDEIIQSATILGETWRYKVHRESTPNSHIDEIYVDVFKDEDHPLTSLKSYGYA